MADTLPIGDFSRATNLSVKALRYYHRVGLLEPAHVDPHTGYRRYTIEQIPTAQIIRRFRDLDMPIEQVQSMLTTTDLGVRNELISAHLAHLEDGVMRTQATVASLRNLLQPAADPSIHRRTVQATPAAAITETVGLADTLLWLQGTLGELQAMVSAQNLKVTGPAGGIFSDELFNDEHGQATIFMPCAGDVRPMGRVIALVVPAIELAITEHTGPHTDIDRAYGALATYVTRHALAVAGPLREYYPVSQLDTAEPSQWRTEIGWPIFNTTT